MTAAPTRRDAITQEIRLAVVLNGGVSLAIWMSGVTHELNRLVQASRSRDLGEGRDAYADLLGVLQAEARIDVIAGTSAGGINGGFLALGVVHGTDLADLRKLWQSAGSLGTLLRNPRDKNQPSLLRGEYFHTELRDAYLDRWNGPRGIPAPDGEDVDLFLTGTLWSGRRSFFADDMGRRITERDYDATFHFTSDPEVLGTTPAGRRRGNLHEKAVTDQLAVASRCTASFPAAFEPYPVHVDLAPDGEERQRLADGRWASDAGRTNFELPQFVIDGGILRNKPIRPAIDAVYRQPAGQQVRRILAYVVPDPGEAPTGPGVSNLDDVPVAGDVMLGVLTRLRSTDSVADELAEIRRRNHETTHRRSTRDRMARTLFEAAATQCAETLLASAYPGYLEVRLDDSAQSVARLLTASPLGAGWSERELATELRVVLSGEHRPDAPRPDLPFVPPPDVQVALGARDADWRWGQATVRRLGDLVVDVLKRAVWLTPLTDEGRSSIVAQRERTHRVLQDTRVDRMLLDDFWRTASPTTPRPPGRTGSPQDRGRGKALPLDDEPATAATREELMWLREELAHLVARWNDLAGGTEPTTARLYRRAFDLADCLREAGDALRSVARGPRSAVDRRGVEQERLRPMVELLVPDGRPTEQVLHDMLRLEILHIAFAGVADVAEQAVELVQVSSIDKKLVTGIQLHHFGAFYRESWRANDWMRGRLDGSQQLIEMLLAPERLWQLGVRQAAQALELLEPVAVGPPSGPWHDQLGQAWNDSLPALTAELEALEKPEPLPRTFPLIAERIAERLHVELLEDELRTLADATVHEPDPVKTAVQWADRVLLDLHAHQNATPPTRPRRAELLGMLQGSHVVGGQTIGEEAARGSDTFAQTVTHAAATLTGTVASIQKPKAAVALLKSLRGYAVLLWVLVSFATGGSKFGRNLTHVVLGVGGALVALTLLVPGVPAVVPATGVVLILAAAGAAAIREGKRRKLHVAGRLAVALVLALGALVFLLWRRMEESGKGWKETALDLAPPVLVVIVVVLLGWFIGRPAKKAS